MTPPKCRALIGKASPGARRRNCGKTTPGTHVVPLCERHRLAAIRRLKTRIEDVNDVAAARRRAK